MDTLSLHAPASTAIARVLDATARTPLVSEIVALHGEIITAARTSLDKAIRIGELLTEQKAQLKHGQWLPWLKDNIPFAERTARNYMRCHAERERLKSASVADLGEAYRLFAPPETTDQSALQDSKTPRDAPLFPPDNRFIPKPGHTLTGHGDIRGTHYWAWIVPHVQDGWFFVNVISNDAWRSETSPATYEFTKKAIRKDELGFVLNEFLPFDAAATLTWEQKPCGQGWEWNELAYQDHQQYMDEVVLGKGRTAA